MVHSVWNPRLSHEPAPLPTRTYARVSRVVQTTDLPSAVMQMHGQVQSLELPPSKLVTLSTHMRLGDTPCRGHFWGPAPGLVQEGGDVGTPDSWQPRVQGRDGDKVQGGTCGLWSAGENQVLSALEVHAAVTSSSGATPAVATSSKLAHGHTVVSPRRSRSDWDFLT